MSGQRCPNPTIELLQRRHCTRAFLSRPVPKEVVAEVLRAAQNAPSSKNMQPWQVTVLTGKARDAFSNALVDAHNRGMPKTRDFVSSPPANDIPIEMRQNIATYGKTYFAALGIERSDKAARNKSRIRNLQFFDAPMEIVVHVPSRSVAGTFFDVGLFVENVIVGLLSHGIGCCPQGCVASLAPVVKRFLGIGDDRFIVIGLAVGYPDPSAAVNRYYPPRVPLEQCATFVGSDDVVVDSENGQVRLRGLGYVPLTFTGAAASSRL